MSKERLQKIVARAGISSRRKAEELIASGRVRVDGRVVTEPGTQADLGSERVEVDGRRIAPEPFVYLAMHKPRSVMCTLRDPEGRPTILELLKQVPVRVVPIGRLDFQTSGILLLTNDGDFAAALSHPKTGAPKEYVAKVRGMVSDTDLERWRESIVIDGRPTQPAEVKRLRIEGDKTWLSLVLHEGRNRQVRRLGEAVGFPVLRLVRMSFAGISHEGIRLGEFRHLTADELRALKTAYGVPRRIHAAVDLEELRRMKPERDGSRRGDGAASGRRHPSSSRVDSSVASGDRSTSRRSTGRQGGFGKHVDRETVGTATERGTRRPAPVSRPRSSGGPRTAGNSRPRKQRRQ